MRRPRRPSSVARRGAPPPFRSLPPDRLRRRSRRSKRNILAREGMVWDSLLGRVKDRLALLGKGAQALGGIGGAHVLADEVPLHLEPAVQLDATGPVDQRLHGAAGSGALGRERRGHLVDDRLQRSRRGSASRPAASAPWPGGRR